MRSKIIMLLIYNICHYQLNRWSSKIINHTNSFLNEIIKHKPRMIASRRKPEHILHPICLILINGTQRMKITIKLINF